MEASPPDRDAIELATRIATRQTFGPYYDEPESPFYEADGLTPEETWERLAEKVALVDGRGNPPGAS